MCGSARAMGTGATRLQPGALHPEQRGVPQGSQCCTPVQAGCGVVPTALRMVGLFHLAAHPLLLAGEKILGILGVGGGGGRGWNYSFLFPPPCFSVLQTSTHHFFTVCDSPAPVFNLFAIFRARTSSTNVPAFHNFLFAKTSKPSQKAAAAPQLTAVSMSPMVRGTRPAMMP